MTTTADGLTFEARTSYRLGDGIVAIPEYDRLVWQGNTYTYLGVSSVSKPMLVVESDSGEHLLVHPNKCELAA